MMRRMAVLGLMLVTACAGGGASESGELDGEELFGASVLADQAGCITCHSLAPDRVLVGPSMAGIGTRAASRVDGQSARDYLRESIVDPDAYIVQGFQAGAMLPDVAELLSEQQLDNLVAFLMTLK